MSHTNRWAVEPSFVVAVVGRTIPNVASIAELAQQSVNYDRPVAYITHRRYPPLARRRNVNKRDARVVGLAAFGREKAAAERDGSGPNRGFIVNSLTQELSRGTHAWALPHEGERGVPTRASRKLEGTKTRTHAIATIIHLFSACDGRTKREFRHVRYVRVLRGDNSHRIHALEIFGTNHTASKNALIKKDREIKTAFRFRELNRFIKIINENCSIKLILN